jgi:hypothetical protein
MRKRKKTMIKIMKQIKASNLWFGEIISSCKQKIKKILIFF